MPDGIHISRLAAHQITGLLSVEKREVFHQKPAVEFIAHIVENALGTGFEDDLVGEPEDTPYQSHG